MVVEGQGDLLASGFDKQYRISFNGEVALQR
jgi:hypothetical protein